MFTILHLSFSFLYDNEQVTDGIDFFCYIIADYDFASDQFLSSECYRGIG
jgi:hypothetical protein